MILTATQEAICGGCGRPAAEGERELSRHSTSEGVVVWARCRCGELQVRLQRYGADVERVVASGNSSAARSRPNNTSAGRTPS